ncbi:hypothetical protein EXIGLDRAFT_726842 [Exidia glandulosa HHB12029]|uniref:Uncharacterized protein n=1 Tax=Exidia glandulosa HHB12029 TaxID=1314781 RepID=A0A165DKJ8_EXIGL|nr:hypothetical protein EXIGLDRAFT_726842 [Exidia glandulosa HHB12029]
MSRTAFPPRYRRDDPPPFAGIIQNGRRVPTYAMAWKCPEDTLRAYTAAEGGLNALSRLLALRWRKVCGEEFFTRSGPIGLFRNDTYFLIVMFNDSEWPDFRERSMNPNDAYLSACAKILFTEQGAVPMFKWYRWPLREPHPDDPLSEDV